MALRHETHDAAKAAHEHSRTAAEQAGAAADHAKTAADRAAKAADLSRSAIEAVTAHRNDSVRRHGDVMKRFDALAEQLAENARLHDRVHELEREKTALVAANQALHDENVRLSEFVPATWPLAAGASSGGSEATVVSGAPEPAGQNGEAGTAGPAVIKPARTPRAAGKTAAKPGGARPGEEVGTP